jgi:purine-binding chemotaxis protein CheW
MTKLQNGDTHSESQDLERLSLFEIDGKLFGIEISRVREVVPVPPLTPLPNSDPIFLGVFNLRGEIYPLVDIAPILGLTPKTVSPTDMVIIVEDPSGYPLGILIDKIHSIITCSVNDYKDPRGIAPKSMEYFLSGVLPYRDNLIYKLDVTELYRTRQLMAHS